MNHGRGPGRQPALPAIPPAAQGSSHDRRCPPDHLDFRILRPQILPGSLIYTPWPADDWNELDFEYLGAFRDRIQTNAMVYTGPPIAKPVDHSVPPTGHEEMIHLGFDPSADFHVYSLEWTPGGVRYLIDGKLMRTWNKEIARLHLPQNILLTIWASSAEGWAGAVDATTAPTSAAYDWIRVSSWEPSGNFRMW